MKTEVETIDNKVIIKTALKDFASEHKGTLDVVIEISPSGIEIRPANEEDLYASNGVFRRETWTEFYGSQLQTYVWDGTQEDPVIRHVLLEKGPQA